MPLGAEQEGGGKQHLQVPFSCPAFGQLQGMALLPLVRVREAEGKPTARAMALLWVGVASEHDSTLWKTVLILGDGEGG